MFLFQLQQSMNPIGCQFYGLGVYKKMRLLLHEYRKSRTLTRPYGCENIFYISKYRERERESNKMLGTAKHCAIKMP